MSTELILLKDIVKVRKVGSSLCFTLPSNIVRLLNLNSSSIFFVYIDQSNLIYSLTPVKTHKFKIIKPRVASKQNEKVYFVITIPKEYSDLLNINVDDYVYIECYKNKLVVKKEV
jgi:hypothetical protein